MKKSCLFERCFEFASDESCQRFAVNEKVGFVILPAVILDTTAGDDKMKVRMIDQLSGPGLQNAHQTNVGPKKPFVPGQQHNGLC